jgi:hypothetical protein
MLAKRQYLLGFYVVKYCQFPSNSPLSSKQHLLSGFKPMQFLKADSLMQIISCIFYQLDLLGRNKRFQLAH